MHSRPQCDGTQTWSTPTRQLSPLYFSSSSATLSFCAVACLFPFSCIHGTSISQHPQTSLATVLSNPSGWQLCCRTLCRHICAGIVGGWYRDIPVACTRSLFGTVQSVAGVRASDTLSVLTFGSHRILASASCKRHGLNQGKNYGSPPCKSHTVIFAKRPS